MMYPNCSLPNFTHLGYNFGMKNRIKEIRELRGISQEKLAELTGTSRSQIVKLERGERRLSQDWMERLAAPVGCAAADFITEIEPALTGRKIEVKGYVQAGLWAESNELAPDDWLAIDSHGAYDHYRRVSGLQVRGDSMDRRFPPGTILIVCQVDDYGRAPETDDYVVVCRRCADGLHEWTIKAPETPLRLGSGRRSIRSCGMAEAMRRQAQQNPC